MGALYDEPKILIKPGLSPRHNNKFQPENIRDRVGKPRFFAGQLVKGLITRVGKSITLNINGQEVKAPGNLFRDAVPGMLTTLKVLNVTDRQAELQFVGREVGEDRKSFISIIKLNSDRSILSSLKELDARRAERAESIRASRRSIGDITFRMTGKDYSLLEKEGLSADKMSAKSVGSALTRIKKMVQQHESPETQSRDKGNSKPMEEYIREKLKRADLPSDDKTVKQITDTLDLSEIALNMDVSAVKGLFARGLAPTIGNMYKAQFDRGNKMCSQGISEQEWEKLQPQARQILKESHYEVNDESLANARWLVDNDIPLNRENLDYIDGLRELDQYKDKELILDRILEGMAEGLAPEDIPLLPEFKHRAEQLIKDMEAIEEHDISRAILEDRALSIEELNRLHYEASVEAEQASDELTKEQQYGVVRAQRQLEEIRLKMTVEAAARIMKQGIDLETVKLAEVVEQLKLLEDNIYKELLNEAEGSFDIGNIQALKSTLLSMDRLKEVPISVLGTTLNSRARLTIPGLLERGDKLAAVFNKANEAYEALMTRPDREYGDSIQKAFKNTEGLLKEMDIESTVYNQRAVRILGYNGMDINRANIDRVKAYDLEVNTLIKKLHPAVAVRLIKEGINPLELPIHKLNERIDELKKHLGISQEDRFSDYLMKLDRRKELPINERKAFIGIYRLLHNVEKTDGAALGAVIKAGRAVTLENLLTAVRIYHKGRMDTVINDEFGLLQEKTIRGESISEQIEAAYTESDTLNGINGEAEAKDQLLQNQYQETDEQTEFMNTVIKQLSEEMTPEKLAYVQDHIENASHVLLRSQDSAMAEPTGSRIWSTIRNVSAEVLFDLTSDYNIDNNSEDAVYEHKLQEMKELFRDSEQSIRFLEDYKVPCTPANLMAAGQILANGGTWYKRLVGLRDENRHDNQGKELKKSLELADKLTDRQSMEEAYEELDERAAGEIEEQLVTGHIDVVKLAELKSLRIQLSLANTLAKREFYQIPLETRGGITNINVTIIRGSMEAGKVAVTVYSDKLGRLKADMSLKDNKVNGLIVGDNRKGMDILEGFLKGYKEKLEEYGLEVKQLDMVLQKGAGDNDQFRDLSLVNNEGTSSIKAERLLYRIAREMVLTVRDAELSI